MTFPSAQACASVLRDVTEDNAEDVMLTLMEMACERNGWQNETAVDYVIRMMRVAVMGHSNETQLIEWLGINGGADAGTS